MPDTLSTLQQLPAVRLCAMLALLPAALALCALAAQNSSRCVASDGLDLRSEDACPVNITSTAGSGELIRAEIALGLLGPIAVLKRKARYAAVHGAIARVNAENTRVTFRVLEFDSKGEGVEGSRAVMQAHTARVPVVIGPAFSGVTAQVAPLLKMMQIPAVSGSASSPALSDKVKYPTFSRACPSDSLQAHAVVALLRNFGFRQFGTFSGIDNYETALVEAATEAAALEGVVVAKGAQTVFDFDHAAEYAVASNVDVEEAVRRALLALREADARVIVAAVLDRPDIDGTGRSAYQVLASAARDLGMFGHEWLWILPDVQDGAAKVFPDYTLALRASADRTTENFKRFRRDTLAAAANETAVAAWLDAGACFLCQS